MVQKEENFFKKLKSALSIQIMAMQPLMANPAYGDENLKKNERPHQRVAVLSFIAASNYPKSNCTNFDFWTFPTMTSDHDCDHFHFRWSGHSHCHKSLSDKLASIMYSRHAHLL